MTACLLALCVNGQTFVRACLVLPHTGSEVSILVCVRCLDGFHSLPTRDAFCVDLLDVVHRHTGGHIVVLEHS